jgi:hypothetical protein
MGMDVAHPVPFTTLMLSVHHAGPSMLQPVAECQGTTDPMNCFGVVQVFYYIPVDMLIAAWFADPAFVEARSTQRGEELQNLCSYLSSPEALRVNQATNGALFHMNNSYYELGGDAVQIFSQGRHKSTVILLRQVLWCSLCALQRLLPVVECCSCGLQDTATSTALALNGNGVCLVWLPHPPIHMRRSLLC